MAPEQMLHLFIDANVLLSFFEYSEDDLNTIKTVIQGLQEERIYPYINSQLWDEVLRNREAKIASALKKLNEQKLDMKFPTICRGFEEYDRLKELQRDYSKTHGKLLETLKAAVVERTLVADGVLEDYFNCTKRGDITAALLARAKDRIDAGNPPDKSNSIGDAIHWEWLLDTVPSGNDLHIVSMDKNFASEIDPKRIHVYLEREWQDKKGAEVHLYNNLKAFFDAKLPNIKLPSDFVKQKLIDRLLGSGGFSTTHSAIKDLNQVEITSPQEATTILEGCLSNNQIHWILADLDVAEFCRDLVMKFEKQLDPALVAQILKDSTREDSDPDDGEPYDPFAD